MGVYGSNPGSDRVNDKLRAIRKHSKFDKAEYTRGIQAARWSDLPPSVATESYKKGFAKGKQNQNGGA